MRLDTTMRLFRLWNSVQREMLTHERDLETLRRQEVVSRVRRYRPHASWKQIAESLGVSQRTLHTYRKEYGLE